MKKVLKNIAYFLTLSLAMTSCKSQLDDFYVDPDKTTAPSIEKLFSGILENNRNRPNYYEMRTNSLVLSSVFAQTCYINNVPTAYVQSMDYTGTLWRDYYVPTNQSNNPNDANSGNGVIAQYRTMQRLNRNLLGDEIENYSVFMLAAEALMLDQTAQMVDMWGDIPFKKAGQLDVDNTIAHAPFDNEREVYDSVIIGLERISGKLDALYLKAGAAASFSAQDFLLKGNLQKWRRFVNSLRLRYLMRISYVDEARARTEVQKMLSNSLDWPLIDGDGASDNYNPGNTDVLLHQFTNYTDNLNRAFTEISKQAAPDFMLNKMMLPVNDPRIPFMFDKNNYRVGDVFMPNDAYRAMRYDMPAARQSDSLKFCSVWDSTAYLYNGKIPGIYMSAPEVNFLKAEALERWGEVGTAGSAQAAYETAIRQSVAFSYYLYNINPNKFESLVQPTVAQVTTFLQAGAVSYTGTQDEKLDKIWSQKWLFFNVLQSRQAWAEIRRTKHPVIPFVNSTNTGYEYPPNRLVYPTNETSYNSSYTEEMRTNDNRNRKIFWDVRP
jgi:hypothetical protein